MAASSACRKNRPRTQRQRTGTQGSRPAIADRPPMCNVTAGDGEAGMAGKEPDLASLDGLFEALYSSISGPPGGQDFELSRRIHHPDARLVRTRLDEEGRPVALSFSVDDYEANVRGLLTDMHFYEIETARRTVRFGNVAQAFSAYEARDRPEGGALIKR